jgi:hypothetical protein
MKELGLINSKNKVILDEEDHIWISRYKWEEVTYKRKDDLPKTFIKRTGEKIYLHRFMFAESRHLIFVQLDGDIYNYTRRNIEFRSYYREHIYKIREYTDKDKLKPGGIYINIDENNCVIRSSETGGREYLCYLCSEIDYYNWYRNCLDVAAHENFRNWTCKVCPKYSEIKKVYETRKDMKETDLIHLLKGK